MESTFALAIAFAAAASGIVWKIANKWKYTLFKTEEERRKNTPILVLGLSLVCSFLGWAATANYTLDSLAVFLLGGLFISAGSEYIYQRTKPQEDEQHL